MKVSEIRTSDTFKIFPIDDRVLNSIKENIESNGYDSSQPIIIWKDRNIVVDGHTRLLASQRAGIDDVPVFEKEFADEDEAVEYAIHNQRDRRNMTDSDIIRCVNALDKRKQQGERTDLAQSCAKLDKGKSAEQTAEVIGISPRKVEQIRTVLDYADEETKQEVIDGRKSINKAYEETQAYRKQEQAVKGKSTFNLTNEKIEWAKWTWNPVTGCLGPDGNGVCEYCYAYDIANRFYSEKFKPTFRPERLEAPFDTAIPEKLKDEPGIHNVFVCSMGDLFGDWVPVEWMQQVLDVCRQTPKWTYIFLTKNPKRMIGIDFPDNAWVGATVDVQARVEPTVEAFRKTKAKVKFISVEPMLEEITFHDLDLFDWVIIGGRSKSSKLPECQPEWEWVKGLLLQAWDAGCKVYFKPNLTVVPKEYPNQPKSR